MSDSLSSADRDARIAEIEAAFEWLMRAQADRMNDYQWTESKNAEFWQRRAAFVAELRAALSREEEAKQQSIVGMGAMQAMLQEMRLASGEAKKDAERYRAIRDGFSSAKWADMPIIRPFSLEHEKYVTPQDFDLVADVHVDDARFAAQLAAARSVSLSENG